MLQITVPVQACGTTPSKNSYLHKVCRSPGKIEAPDIRFHFHKMSAEKQYQQLKFVENRIAGFINLVNANFDDFENKKGAFQKTNTIKTEEGYMVVFQQTNSDPEQENDVFVSLKKQNPWFGFRGVYKVEDVTVRSSNQNNTLLVVYNFINNSVRCSSENEITEDKCTNIPIQIIDAVF